MVVLLFDLSLKVYKHFAHELLMITDLKAVHLFFAKCHCHDCLNVCMTCSTNKEEKGSDGYTF